ncbi:MAG: calcium/sodium antiporter [Candidatus Aminicenantaceae bacterium]
MWTYILFVFGFVLLIKGADFLVEGSSSIARRLKISDLVIGLTVVAFGTSSPELFVNTIASVKGNAAIAVGNIVGSNIANIFLILGISAVIFPLAVEKSVVLKGIPLGFLAALLLCVLANDKLIDKDMSSVLTRIDGFVFIFFFIIFLYYSFGAAKTIKGVKEHAPEKQFGIIKSSLIIILGLGGLVLGGKWIVDGAVSLASSLGVSQTFVGLTVIAVGTSLPELATSAVAAYKKNAEIAVGNVVGSNIFNIFFILGVSSVIRPLPFQMKQNIDISVMVFANLILFVSMFSGKKRLVDRWEGILFILLYLIYITFLVIQG